MKRAILFLAFAAAATGAPDSVHRFHEAAISPDGKTVAWAEQTSDDPDASKISLKPVDSASGRETSLPQVGAKSIAWAPDSARLAFLAPAPDADDPKQLQIYIASADGKQAHSVSSLKGDVSGPVWSPDGRRIAFLYIENAPRAAGPLEAVSAPVGVIGDAIFLQRLCVLDVASGQVKTVSPANLYVYEYDWSPDGKRFVYTAAPGPGDDNWYIAKLYTCDIESGAARAIHETEMQMAQPVWSPDGATVAFIAGLMSDEGATGGDIYTVPSSGGEATDRTPGRKSSPSWIHWLPSSRRILFSENVGGSVAIATLDLKGGSTETLWKGDESIAAAGGELSVTKDGTAAALIRSSWVRPPEVWAGKIGEWREITHANESQKPSWGQARNVEWKNEGFDVQGWLLLPVGYDAGKRYPMIVVAHGGPASVVKPGWPSDRASYALLSNQGYFVFMPNPRGSYGQGEAFTRANVKDFGYGDLRDILAGVDAIEKQFSVDDKRVGITGWSYGGFMTMFAVTQTQRFRAAVAGAGLSNWQSYYGENSIDQWMIPYFGASVYDDPAVYAKSSAMNFIKNVKTPTLVVVGERDGECPAPQSFEFWHALKTLGVKTELVVYAGEGHRFHDPEHIRDRMERTVAWFNENMK